MKKTLHVLITLALIAVIGGLVYLLVTSGKKHKKTELTAYVNPFIGTGGHGHTYPGATMPFGMVQLSPDTRITGWDGCGGYHYTDTIIYGFSHTHLSGTGIPDYGDILIMPTTGRLYLNSGYISETRKTNLGYGSSFSKKTETARPGYYSVKLRDYGIKAELTATERCGFHRYIYPENAKNAKIILDLKHRDNVISSGLYIINDSTVAGYRISSAWARKQYIYFYMKFSKPFKSYKIAYNDSIIGSPAKVDEKNLKAVFYFENAYTDTLLVKVGISAVDTAGAHKNLEAEIPDWDFDRIVQKADSAWNAQLGKIEVKADSQTMVKFYTALYHTMVAPNLFMDVDGRYRSTDLKIHKDSTFTNYTVFSLWDTYRATHPLYTIIEQKRTNDFIRTFLKQYEYGGLLPMWELAGNYTYTMIGYHAAPIIADAYLKGINDFDAQLAMEAMKHSANQRRFGIPAYKRFGYIPQNYASASVSRTLEYSFDDWCIAQMAWALGDANTYKIFEQRAQYWKNVFDPQTKFMRAKFDAIWVSPFDPFEVNQNYTEANAWQYSLYVPQDILTLTMFLGGYDSLASRLDTLFNAPSKFTGLNQPDITGMIGQYAHGNEPSHQLAYMYVFAGAPWKTQEIVRKIMKKFYTTQPDGYIGNEDCGQMSAWYVLSALGFYPVTPCSGEYILGSPAVNKATINLENGKKFRIVVKNQGPKNIYVKSVRLNGQPLRKLSITHKEIMEGGTLVFEMSNKPSNLGMIIKPYTQIRDYLITPAPFVYPVNMTFKDKLTFRLGDVDTSAKIYYTFDTTAMEYQLYTKPITITNSKTVYFFAQAPDKIQSKVQIARFQKYNPRWTIKLNTQYAQRYAAGGNNALIDGLLGGLDYRLGLWQGYEGINLDAELDLQKVQRVNSVAIRFLQDIDAWIFMPEEVRFYYSKDGRTWHEYDVVKNDVNPQEQLPVIKVFKTTKPVTARYIRVVGVNRGTCPAWHKGAGGKCWIFADEIFVK